MPVFRPTLPGVGNLTHTTDIRDTFVGLTPSKAQKVIKRFWSKVNVGDPWECWVWTGGCDKDGYGHFCVNGRSRRTHRLSYLLARGHWPLECCLHYCDTPPCCNPLHLREGTHQDNVIDRDQKGRQAQGESNGRAKLTWIEVEQIRSIYAEGRWTMSELADYFGISRRQVGNIVYGRSWTERSPVRIPSLGTAPLLTPAPSTTEDDQPTDCFAVPDSHLRAHGIAEIAGAPHERRAA